MRADLRCAAARIEISARLDGEADDASAGLLDAHLAVCAACRRHEGELATTRRALRLQPVGAVPDLADSIMERIDKERGGRSRRTEWASKWRIAGIAAAVAALLLIASLPEIERPTGVARAGEIAGEVRLAARSLEGYAARFEITERGWHEDVGVRHFSATMSFDAPERLALKVRDLTTYPGPRRWPQNDVDVIANARRYWIKEPSFCPPSALPGCVASPAQEQRSIVHRGPFDGTSALPTDIVVPLETLASTGSFAVLGTEGVAGRSAYHIALPYRRAVPLIDSLRAGGSWRSFHPLDRVDIWIDRGTWFPLRYSVAAGSSQDRRAWARNEAWHDDAAGEVLYEVEAVHFAERESFGSGLFDAPRRGIVRSGGFSASAFPASTSGVPATTAGLEPYRAGATGDGRRVLAYADGMTWLKVVTERHRPSRPSASPPGTAEEIAIESGNFVYYQPATEMLKRRIDIYGRSSHIHLESNLSRRRLLAVAASIGARGRRAGRVERSGGYSVRRVDAGRSFWFAARAEYLPPSYGQSSALLSRSNAPGRTLTAYYGAPEAEYEGFGVRITQSSAIGTLAPSAEDGLRSFELDGVTHRWSTERGELEWIERVPRAGGAERSVYRAVAVPSFDLTTALRIAEGLR